MVVAIAAVVVAFAGCSSVEPTDAWTSEAGRVSGTVRSDTGTLLADIEVWVWAELAPDGREVCYQTETVPGGTYEIDGIEMATEQSVTTAYWIAANRDPDATTPIRSHYGAVSTSIYVSSGETYVWDAVIDFIHDDPDGPETYVEG